MKKLDWKKKKITSRTAQTRDRGVEVAENGRGWLRTTNKPQDPISSQAAKCDETPRREPGRGPRHSHVGSLLIIRLGQGRHLESL